MNLKEEYLSQFDYNKIKAFVQYFSIQLSALSLSTEMDIELFHYNTKRYALVADVTGSTAAKVGTKIIMYYSLLLCDKTRSNESLAITEILSDS